MAMTPILTGLPPPFPTRRRTAFRLPRLLAVAVGPFSPPDVVVASSDWPKVWTRAPDRCKGIVATELLTHHILWRGTRPKAASQAGGEIRRRNIFCFRFRTGFSAAWDVLGISG